MDALHIERAVLAGYDWGGRAACVVSALWPERVVALVSGNSYNIQNIARAMEPAAPSEEAALWYQYYFHSERGRRGLEKDRRGIARLLWRMWSPTWGFDDGDVRPHRDRFRQSRLRRGRHPFVPPSLRPRPRRSGLAPIEAALAAQPPIAVPSITIDGDADGVNCGTAHHGDEFAGRREHRVSKGAGHNLPQERPGNSRAPFSMRARWRCRPPERPSNRPRPRRTGIRRRTPPSHPQQAKAETAYEIRDAHPEEFEAVGSQVEAYSNLNRSPSRMRSRRIMTRSRGSASWRRSPASGCSLFGVRPWSGRRPASATSP